MLRGSQLLAQQAVRCKRVLTACRVVWTRLQRTSAGCVQGRADALARGVAEHLRCPSQGARADQHTLCRRKARSTLLNHLTLLLR